MLKNFFLLLFTILMMQLNAQHFINSSIPRMSGNVNNSLAIQFKSSDKCIDIQNGVAVLNGLRINGIFSIICKEEKALNKFDLKFYPNPVYNMAKIQFLQSPPLQTEFTISAWNTLGSKLLLMKETGANLYRGITLDMTRLSSGTYVLVIESNNFLDAIKFIKKD